MRIAHILRKYVPTEWGGTETALLGLTTGLGAHGDDSIVFCPENGRPARVPDPLTQAGADLRRFRACVPVWGLEPAVRRQMLAVGGNLLSFDLPGMLLREPGLDVIHSHVLGRIGGIAGTVARRRNIPFVLSIHGGAMDLPDTVRRKLEEAPRSGVEWGRLFGWWWRARHVLEEADAILTGNSREATLLRERYPGKEIVVRPHGVLTAHFRVDHRAAALEAYPQVANREVLLCVARLDPVKNQGWLVNELAAIAARHPRVLLVLAGACTNAEYCNDLRREVRTRGLENRVLLTGGLPPGDPRVLGLLQLARVFVLASLAETFGIVILEAWAAGSVVLTTGTSGARELVRDGENGCFFQLDDPAGFHARLDRLLTDRAYHGQIAEAGRRHAADFDVVTLTRRVHDLYERLREGKHALRHSA